MNPSTPEEPVFAAPWEARTFALTLALHERGLFTWEEWTSALGRTVDRDDGTYYEHWLAALEELVVVLGLVADR
jgi:nitrile hydratase accessory protein